MVREWRRSCSWGLGLAIVVAILASAAAQETARTPAPPQDGAKAPDKRMQAEAHYELGVMYHERVFESLDQAIAEYEKAVRLHPEYAEAHYNLALSYHTKAKLGTDDKAVPKALAEYKLYLKYSPEGELAAKAKLNIRAVEARLR
jgi:Tfp pilus assembly protein PilF